MHLLRSVLRRAPPAVPPPPSAELPAAAAVQLPTCEGQKSTSAKFQALLGDNDDGDAPDWCLTQHGKLVNANTLLIAACGL